MEKLSLAIPSVVEPLSYRNQKDDREVELYEFCSLLDYVNCQHSVMEVRVGRGSTVSKDYFNFVKNVYKTATHQMYRFQSVVKMYISTIFTLMKDRCPFISLSMFRMFAFVYMPVCLCVLNFFVCYRCRGINQGCPCLLNWVTTYPWKDHRKVFNQH